MIFKKPSYANNFIFNKKSTNIKNSENSEGQFPIDAIETIDNITNNISEIFKTEGP